MVILQTIPSGSAINIEKCRIYYSETVEVFVHVYLLFLVSESAENSYTWFRKYVIEKIFELIGILRLC